MDSHTEVKYLFDQLKSWREVSQREFSNIINSHSKLIGRHQFFMTRINNGINELVEKVTDLEERLSVITNERNDLLGTVDNLSGEIRELNAKLTIEQPLREPDPPDHGQGLLEVGNPQLEVLDIKQELIERTSFSILLDRQGEDIGKNSTIEHQDETHVNSTIFTEKKEKIVKSEQYPNTTSYSKNLKKHIKGAPEKIRKHICGECTYATSRKDNLKQHIRRVHDKTGSHVCGECGYSFTRKDSLKKHIKVVHEKLMNHVCVECGFATSLKDNLRKHIKRVHEKIQNHICDFNIL